MADDQTRASGVVFDSGASDANLVPLNQVKRLKLETAADVRQATEALRSVLSQKPDELFWEDQSANFPLEKGERSLRATNNWARSEVAEHRDQFLLACDVVQFTQEIARWLLDNPNLLQTSRSALDPESLVALAGSPDSNDLVKLWGNVKSANTVDLRQLTNTKDLQTFSRINNALRTVSTFVQQLEPAAAEQTSTTTDAEAEKDQEKKKAAAAATTTTDIAPRAESDESEGANETTEQAVVPEEVLEREQRTESSFSKEALSKQSRRRAEYHEFSWLYNHTLFDLMGKHGIMPNNLVMAELGIVINEHLGSLSDTQISKLFADPSARYGEIKKIYEKLANNPQFVGNLREQFEGFLKTANEDQKKRFVESTGFDSLDEATGVLQAKQHVQKNQGRAETIANTGQYPDAIQESTETLSQLINTKIEGAEKVNFDNATQAIIATLGSAAGFANFDATKKESRSSVVQKFVAALTPERVALIFFANPNNPNVVEQKTIDAIEQSLPQIQAVIATLLQTHSIDEVIRKNHELRRALGIIEKNDETIPEEVMDVTVTSVQTMIGSFQTNFSNEEGESPAEDEHISHTQKLMNDYKGRIARMWGQLSQEQQLMAYAKLFDINLNDETRRDLLDRIKYLENPDGKYLWSDSLFTLIDWEKFIRVSTKDIDARERERQRKQRELVDTTRSVAAEGYLAKLSPKQIEQLQKSSLLLELKEATQYAQVVSDRLKRGDFVSEVEYRGALVALERVQKRISLVGEVGTAHKDGEFDQHYDQELGEVDDKQVALVSELSEFQPADFVRRELTLVETLYLLELEAPVILAPTVLQIEALAQSPNELITDTVTGQTVLAEPTTQSVEHLNRAAAQQGELAGPRDRINKMGQSQQAMTEVASLAADIGKNFVQGKGPQGAIILSIKQYFTDKEFRRKVNNLALKAAQVFMGGFIAGTVMVGLILEKLIGAVGPWGGALAGAAAGGGLGFVIGGPVGAVIGGIGGGIGGYLAGDKLAALSAAQGSELLPASFSSTAGGGSIVSTATPGATATTVSSATPTATATATASPTATAGAGATAAPATTAGATATTATAPTAGAAGATTAGTTTAAASSASSSLLGGTLAGLPIAGLLPGITILSTGLITLYTMFVIFSAFLVPLPVGDLTALNATQSEYATLTKLASPNTLADDQTATIIYKIAFKPRRNYALKVTAVEDTANTGFRFQSARADHVNPQVAPPASLLNPRISIDDFSSDFDNQIQTVEYSVEFSGGRKVLVSNTVTITYDVQNSAGETIATGETIEAIANVSIGDHGVACWPTTGEITQLPGGSYSHRRADAYDVGATLGTRVFVPFDGWAQTGDTGSTDYGKFVTLDAKVQGHWVRLVFGHLRSSNVGTHTPDFWDNVAINHDADESNNVGQQVSAGQLLGTVDSTGNSSGNHLHYELVYIDNHRHHYGDAGLSLNNLLPRPPAGTQYKLGDYVRSCSQ